MLLFIQLKSQFSFLIHNYILFKDIPYIECLFHTNSTQMFLVKSVPSTAILQKLQNYKSTKLQIVKSWWVCNFYCQLWIKVTIWSELAVRTDVFDPCSMRASSVQAVELLKASANHSRSYVTNKWDIRFFRLSIRLLWRVSCCGWRTSAAPIAV